MTMIQFLGEWGVRSSILILAGTLLLWLLRVKNPSVRLTAWTAMLVGSLAIPLLTAALPKVSLPVMRPPARLSPAAASAPTRGPVAIFPSSTMPALIATLAPPPAVPAKSFDRIRLAAILYAVTALALLLRLCGGLIVSLRILRRSLPTGIVVEGTEVRESDRVASPVTIGVLHPAVLLPLDWRDWDSAKLDAVLAHERSHIRRRDPAVQFVSAIHRALLWASPLSWFLHRSIVRTAELISDDDAVAATRDRVSYAEILLEFVQRGAGPTNSLGVPMARYDRPEKRIRRILNSTATPREVTRWGIAAILGLGAPLAYLTAAAHPQSALESNPLTAKIAPAPVARSENPLPAAAPTPKPDPRPAAMQAAAPLSRTTQNKPANELAAFEVASIRPSDPSLSHEGVRIYAGGRVIISNLSLKTLITTAFRLSYWQISGGEPWTEKDRYNIEAKPPVAARSKIKDLRYTWYGIEDAHLCEMLQALLIDRFQLAFHRETKTGDVYVLKRSGTTLRLRLHPTEIPSAGAEPLEDHSSSGNIGYAGGKWNIFAASMPQLAKFAADFILRVPVLDRTELNGSFDYRQPQPDLEPKYDGDQSDSFKSYLKELGLKLERAKGPVETFVIDHAAKPSPN